MKHKFFACFLIICAGFFSLTAQTNVTHQSDKKADKNKPQRFFPLSELKEGMKGTARTVFRGSKPEPFSVEILGIVPGAIGPQQDMIIGKISGGGADRTQVFAGMSGSPVYIDGKLVGAIAYAFPYSKEAICGITPIEQMIKIFEKNRTNPAKDRNPRSYSFAELASANWESGFPAPTVSSGSIVTAGEKNSAVGALAGQSFQPIATPLTFSGFSQATLNTYSKKLIRFGLLPVSGAGGSAKITPIKEADENTLLGGDSVTMQLMRGDFSIAAAGTVTFRSDQKIYAFGHPFIGLGSSNIPMSESHVVTVVPSVFNSFKLSVPDAMVGAMTQDRNTGVLGKLGKVPKMLPVTINLETSRNQQKVYKFEMVNDSVLAPLLLNIAVFNSLTTNERRFGNTTAEVSGKVVLKNHNDLILERRYAGPIASQMAATVTPMAVGTLLRSRFENIEISEVVVNLKSRDDYRTGSLERIEVNKDRVRAGEEIEIKAFVRADTGKVFVRRIPLKIPENTPQGTVALTVGDGFAIQSLSPSARFVPKNANELIEVLKNLKKNDRLYIHAQRVTKGAVIGAKELPNLPPSILATINNSRTVGGFKPTVKTTLIEKEIPPAEFMISGKQSLSIRVVR